MNLRVFKAETMAKCLGQVKAEMGPDAVILHTRTFPVRRLFGFVRKEIVEITAGKGLNTRGPRRSQRLPDRPIIREPDMRDEPWRGSAANGHPQLVGPPPIDSGAVIGLKDQVAGLTKTVNQIFRQIQVQQTPGIREELFGHYQTLIDNKVDPAHATELIKSLERQLRPEHLAQSQFVAEKLAEQLERLMPTSGPITQSRKGTPHVVALIGPTGVGKTTTIAKLAANLGLREKHWLGLITLDTYRIAAVDQLQKFADIIGAPLKVVGTPEQLRAAVASLNECDFILIDTAGRGPNDTLKLNELKTFLAAAGPDEVHLVLSATSSQECAELAIDKFGDVRVDKLIFTKFDEAAHHGTLFNIMRKVNKSLSYVTTGQDVPADIEVARGRRSAQLILGSSL